MIDAQRWMELFTRAVQAAFGGRAVCIGLQGSYSRGEAHEGSDLDPVLVLDDFQPADLHRYRALLDGLPHRDLVCGFAGGRAELEAWDEADLFQFYHDTTVYAGSLDWIAPKATAAAARRAAHKAACDIYHMAVHNFLHEKSPDILSGLYKSAVFALQAKHFCDTGRYCRRRADLAAELTGDDAAVLALGPDAARPERFGDATALLLRWARDLICGL